MIRTPQRFSWVPPADAKHAPECRMANPEEGQVWECALDCPSLASSRTRTEALLPKWEKVENTRDIKGPPSRTDAMLAVGEINNRASREAANERFDRARAPYKVREGIVTEAPSDELWVRSDTGVHALADRLVVMVRDLPHVDLACIGAHTVNTAVKAIAVARERLGHRGVDLWTQPYFSTVEVEARDGDETEERTRLMLRVVSKVV